MYMAQDGERVKMNDNLIYDLYSYAFKHDLPLIVDAADEIKQLRKERDEARRIYLASTCSDDEIITEMKRMGWDCFKEEADYNNEYFRTHHK